MRFKKEYSFHIRKVLYALEDYLLYGGRSTIESRNP